MGATVVARGWRLTPLRISTGMEDLDTGWIRSGAQYVAHPPMTASGPRTLILVSQDPTRLHRGVAVALEELDSIGIRPVHVPGDLRRHVPPAVSSALDACLRPDHRVALMVTDLRWVARLMNPRRRHVFVVAVSRVPTHQTVGLVLDLDVHEVVDGSPQTNRAS